MYLRYIMWNRQNKKLPIILFPSCLIFIVFLQKEIGLEPEQTEGK